MHDGRLLTVTLDGYLELDHDRCEVLADVGRALPGDVRVVLLQGRGDDFCPTGEGLPGGPLPADGFCWWSRPSIVSVAAVHGRVCGTGLELALACDLRVAAEDAVLQLPQALSGTVPHSGGTGRLQELVGSARTLELCLTGRPVGAAEAAAWGLVNRVVPREQLAQAARELVDDLLAASRGAGAEVKALVGGARSRTAREQCEAEREAQVRCLRDLAGTGE